MGSVTSASYFSLNDSNVLAHYKFNENLLDDSGNNYHLTASNLNYYVNFWMSGAKGIVMDGNYGLYLDNPVHNDNLRVNTDVSILFAGMLLNNTGSAPLVGFFGDPASSNAVENDLYGLRFLTGALTAYQHQFGSGTPVSITSSITMPKHELFALGVTREGTTVTLYDKYGQIYQTSSVTVPQGGSNAKFEIAANISGSKYFRGYIQSVLIYSGALSAGEKNK